MYVRWLDDAQDDLGIIRDYIATDDSAAAVFVVQRLVEKGNNLVEFPQLGREGRVAAT